MPSISVCIITLNEEANLARTLASVRWADEIIVVDSGSTDQTLDIARRFGAKLWHEPWQGFAAQKNSALDKASGEWILSLDADEAVSPELQAALQRFQQGEYAAASDGIEGFFLARRNLFLGRWLRHGGYYPDRKLRLFRRGRGRFRPTPVHETIALEGHSANFAESFQTPHADLVHHAYPTLDGYLEHMNRYSTLGAELALRKGHTGKSFASFVANVLIRPQLTFLYNYLIRRGFLDGREGFLQHYYHHMYVSWKYAKAWERARSTRLG